MEDTQAKEKEERSEILMWLDDYNDLFSDFDPRHYSQRALSFDFLSELRRATRGKYGDISLGLLIPKDKRDMKIDSIVRKRLQEYFSKNYLHHKDEAKGVFRRGLMFCFAGIVLMFTAAYLLFYFRESTLLMSFLIILLEPASWFLFWEGLNISIFESKKTKPILEFYMKMAGSKIHFSSY
jgi:hypothetical protein